MKNNKILIIIIIILGTLVIALGGYIICEKLNVKDEDVIVNEEIQDNTLKLDNSKEWVIDAEYNLPTDKDSYYGYSDHSKLVEASDLIVPYININSDDAKNVNDEIYNLYKDLIDKFNDNLKEEILFTLVDYKTYINNNFISIVINVENAGTDVPYYEYYTYNFNLDDGSLLTYDETYKITGFNDSNISDKVEQAINDTIKIKYTNGSDIETYYNESFNNYNKSVSDNNIKFFIDDNEKFNIVVTLSMPVGRGSFDTIITIE